MLRRTLNRRTNMSVLLRHFTTDTHHQIKRIVLQTKSLLLLGWSLCGLLPALYAQKPQVQWASKLLEFSSEHSENAWSARQVLGPPNAMPQGGDSPTAWAPKFGKGIQYVKVGFKDPMPIRQVAIVENFNPGAIMNVYAYDTEGKEYLLRSFQPDFKAPSFRILSVTVPVTPYAVASVKVELNNGIIKGKNTLDAIAISDSEQPIETDVYLSEEVSWYRNPIRLSHHINSEHNEFKPLVSPDGQTLYFVRAYHPDNVGGISDKEDIWISTYDPIEAQWRPAQNPGTPLNTAASNQVASVLPDGNLALINYVYVPGSEYNPDESLPGASISLRDTSGKWGFPRKVDIQQSQNRSEKQDHFLSNSGQLLLLSAERDHTEGMRDLYVSFLNKDGSWSSPQSLGPTVNTAGDESAPFLAADNRTLYFSSNGFPSYGRADIYVTRRLGEGWQDWTKPANLGPLINTEVNDTYFSMDAAGERAYFTRRTDDRTYEDIYSVQLAPSHRPLPVAFVSGKILSKADGRPLAATITCENLSTGKREAIATTNPATGTYTLVLPAGIDYGLVARAPGHLPTSQHVNLTEQLVPERISRDVFAVPDEVGQVLFLNNVFFEPLASTYHPTSAYELDRLAQYLRQNPRAEVVITGHTSGEAEAARGESLPLSRAKAVGAYLRGRGIKKKRITEKGYGGDMVASTARISTSTETIRINGLVDVLIIRK